MGGVGLTEDDWNARVKDHLANAQAYQDSNQPHNQGRYQMAFQHVIKTDDDLRSELRKAEHDDHMEMVREVNGQAIKEFRSAKRRLNEAKRSHAAEEDAIAERARVAFAHGHKRVQERARERARQAGR